MEVYLKIICAHEAIPTIKQRIYSLYSLINADLIEEVIHNYWKCEQCSVYNIQFHCINPDLDTFKSELSKISGGKHVEVEHDGIHIDMSCYTTIPELLSNPNSSFVTCYIAPE